MVGKAVDSWHDDKSLLWMKKSELGEALKGPLLKDLAI